jgi:hypothetical protein
VLGRIGTMAPGPHWFVISPDGMTGYASNKEAPFLTVVDLLDGTPTHRIDVPGDSGLAVSGDGTRVYLAAPYASFGDAKPEAAPGIRVIDTTSRSVVAALATDNIDSARAPDCNQPTVGGRGTNDGWTGDQWRSRRTGVAAGAGMAHRFLGRDPRKTASIDVGRCPLTLRPRAMARSDTWQP